MADDIPPVPGYTRPEQDEIARLVQGVIERATRAGISGDAAAVTDMLLRELRTIGARLVLERKRMSPDAVPYAGNEMTGRWKR
jgi:hypothetical protein